MSRSSSRAVRMIGIVALFWNLLGLMALGLDFYVTTARPETLTPIERALADAMPMSSIIGGFVAVGAGLIGSLGLIVRQSWSIALFGVSVLGVIVQDTGLYLTARGLGVVLENAPVLLQTAILVFALLLLAYSARARQVGLLH